MKKTNIIGLTISSISTIIFMLAMIIYQINTMTTQMLWLGFAISLGFVVYFYLKGEQK